MAQTFDLETLAERRVECEECGWVGLGYETEKKYENLPQAIEIYCPVCRNYLGIVKQKSSGH